MTRYLPTQKVARVYDRIGALQDTQAFYEDPALDVILRHSKFEDAKRVYEAGCGTGRVASRLLRDILSPQALYIGADVSERMVSLASNRTQQWRRNARIVQADVTQFDPGIVDRVLSLFVVDLMDDASIKQFLRRAYDSLVHGGLLCVAGLAEGSSGMEQRVSQFWKILHSMAPAIVGGCRPKPVAPHLDPEHWRVVLVEHQSRCGVTSETVIAAKR